jgi:hypothetical protein
MKVGSVVSGQLLNIVPYRHREFGGYDSRVTHCRHVSNFAMLKYIVLDL